LVLAAGYVALGLIAMAVLTFAVAFLIRVIQGERRRRR
jgi:hypothetical protein